MKAGKDRLWAMEANSLANLMRAADAPAPTPAAEPDQPVQEPYLIDNGVAIIGLVGVMMKYPDTMLALFGGVSTVEVQNNLMAAVDDPAVSGILLYIDSPGGCVSGTVDLADAVANCPKPITAYISDQGCSAAYWVASQADQVYANRSAFVGSIGVYATVVDESKLYADAGVKVHLVKAGESKGIGAEGVEITPEQLSVLQSEIDAIYELFVASVASGRKLDPDAVRQFATGEQWVADKAVALGLIDGITSSGELDKLIGELMADKKIEDVEEEKPEDAKPEDDKPADEVAEGDAVPADDETDKEDKPADEYDKGKGDEQARLDGIVKACNTDLAFAYECYKKGMTVDQAKLAYADKAIKASESMAKELVKLRAGTSGADPVAVAARAVGSGAAVHAAGATGADELKANWDANHNGCRDKFSRFENYKAFTKYSK